MNYTMISMHINTRQVIALFIGVMTITFTQTSSAQSSETEAILESFVDSYRTDPMAMTATFGIQVEDDWWYVTCERKQESYLVGKNKQYTFHNYGPHEVQLHKGPMPGPGWFFEFSSAETLKKIYDRSLTTGTATAKSRGSDVVPLEIRETEGFVSDPGTVALSYSVMEHFWKTGDVEITRFSRDASLPTHGVAHVGLYTMKDKRVGWFSIGPEEAANTERGLDKGQVPNLFIITKGRGRAQLGDEEVELEPGMSVFVGPYVKHVIFNPYDEPMEGIIILYGDNIDFARGKSYMDFKEQELEFYRSYEASLRNP